MSSVASRRGRLPWANAAVMLSFAGHAAAASESDVLAQGRALTQLYLACDTQAVWSRMDAGMQRFVRSEEQLSQMCRHSRDSLGEETEVLSETVETLAGFATYKRTARRSKADVPYVLQWEIAEDGSVAGLGLFDQRDEPEPAPTEYLDYVTQAELHLPFEGEWLVFWGGRTVKQNIHARQQQQRFAYDFARAVDGRMHQGDGTRREHYYCWGTPILAPADATVITAVGDQPDQDIGSMDKANLAGNFVVLDLGHHEYAVMGHLRQNSLRVKVGQRVKAGEQLGECGNSGNTSQPHLHFHVQNAPEFGKGDGLPAFFVDYVADGEPVPRGEPVRGQVIRSD